MGPHGRFLALAILSLALPACTPAGPVLHPVTGQVLFEGQPAAGATVVFHPVQSEPDALRPGAVVGVDGTYTLNTYPHGPGAPAGEYVVLVTWFDDPEKRKAGADAKSKLPARYSEADKSGLKATVAPGENKLEPFRLSRSPR